MISFENLPQLDLLWVPTESLHPNPRNARTHSKKQIKKLFASMREFGFTNPILIDENSQILCGHGRWEAARLTGIKKIPTIRLDYLTPSQKRAYVLADNALAEKAGWNTEILAIELGDLSELLPAEGMDISIVGFDPAEIDLFIRDGIEQGPDPADILPKTPVKPVTRPGDLWLLKSHRLLCGDARDAEA